MKSDQEQQLRRLMPVQVALIGMRKRLGLTQQELAHRLGVSVVSVCRWETVRPPTGLALQKLHRLATGADASEAAGFFASAMSREAWPRGTGFAALAEETAEEMMAEAWQKRVHDAFQAMRELTRFRERLRSHMVVKDDARHAAVERIVEQSRKMRGTSVEQGEKG